MSAPARVDTTPELDLWLAYAGRSGAIHDSDGAGTFLVLLPDALQRTLGLPEEVQVTAAPDAARESGSRLLCAGHPMADAVASRILTAGDAGERWVAWPGTLPRADQLVDSARTVLPVDHGRVDPADQPRALYAPLFRVGVLVTYTLEQRYQEREEVWVDGRTGVPVGRIEEALYAPHRTARRAIAAPDLIRALDGAERPLSGRAERRLQELRMASAPVLREERERALAFYQGALDSLVRRRDAAAPERRSVFSARIEATERERDRRLQELAEKFEPQHSWRPFRLHLVHCPALDVPLVVRRGERTYPLTLTWLLPHAVFVGVRCPNCGAEEPLVAGRSHLGCRSCVVRAAPVPQPAIQLRGRVAPEARAAAAPSVAVPPRQSPPHAKTRPLEAERIQQRREARRLKREAAEARTQHARGVGRMTHAGDRLSLQLWQSCALRKRVSDAFVMPNSPFAVLQRLYGPVAPQVALGLPIAAVPMSSTSMTDSMSSQIGFTWGMVRTARTEHRYVIRWHWAGKQALLFELFPGRPRMLWDPTGDEELTPATAPALFGAAPAPAVALDAVEALLWNTDTARLGVPTVARCIGMWSAMRPVLERVAPVTAAAALATVVGQYWRRPRAASEVSRAYGANPQAVGRVVRELRRS